MVVIWQCEPQFLRDLALNRRLQITLERIQRAGLCVCIVLSLHLLMCSLCDSVDPRIEGYILMLQDLYPLPPDALQRTPSPSRASPQRPQQRQPAADTPLPEEQLTAEALQPQVSVILLISSAVCLACAL